MVTKDNPIHCELHQHYSIYIFIFQNIPFSFMQNQTGDNFHPNFELSFVQILSRFSKYWHPFKGIVDIFSQNTDFEKSKCLN